MQVYALAAELQCEQCVGGSFALRQMAEDIQMEGLFLGKSTALLVTCMLLARLLYVCRCTHTLLCICRAMCLLAWLLESWRYLSVYLLHSWLAFHPRTDCTAHSFQFWLMHSPAAHPIWCECLCNLVQKHSISSSMTTPAFELLCTQLTFC